MCVTERPIWVKEGRTAQKDSDRWPLDSAPVCVWRGRGRVGEAALKKKLRTHSSSNYLQEDHQNRYINTNRDKI